MFGPQSMHGVIFRAPPPHRASADSSASARSMRTNFTMHSTGCWSVSPRSRRRWPSVTSPMARWCWTTCHRATWRDAAARSPSVATAMQKKARCRLSTVCSALPTAVPIFFFFYDPMTLAAQIEKLKQRFRLDHVILVGDRGMITQARITEDIGSAGLDWITALRAPAIKSWSIAARCNSRCSISATWRASPHLTSPASAWWSVAIPISPPANPQARRPPCRHRARSCPHPDRRGAQARSTTRHRRDRTRAGAVINKHKMAKHFELDITDAAFSFARKTTEIAAEAATDGVYVIRTSLPAETFDERPRCAATSHSPSWNAPFAASRPSTCTCGRSITDWPIGSARM